MRILETVSNTCNYDDNMSIGLTTHHCQMVELKENLHGIAKLPGTSI
jgi:hypothetical protein